MSDAHDPFTERLAAYALDALDEREAEQVRAHLAHCPACRLELRRFVEVAGRLPEVLALQSPAPDLGRRVLAAIEQEARPSGRPTRRSVRLRFLWVGLATILVISQIVLLFNLSALRAQNNQLADIQTILLSTDETPIPLTSPDPTSGIRGHYRVEVDLKLGLIDYYHLPPPGSNQSYQCWFELATGATIGCGRLPLEADGHGLLLLTVPETPPIRLWVTLEPNGVSVPSGPTILMAELPPSE